MASHDETARASAESDQLASADSEQLAVMKELLAQAKQARH